MQTFYQSFFRKLANPVLALPRTLKRLAVLLADMLLCISTVYFAFYLRLDYWVWGTSSPFFMPAIWACIVSLILSVPIFIISGLYRTIFRYSGLPALLSVFRAISIYAVLYVAIFTVIGVSGVPKSIGLLQPILLLLGVGATRAIANIWLGGAYLSILQSSDFPKAVIYGAGSAGRQLAAALNNSHEMRLIGFLDDDSRLQGNSIGGLRVYSPDDLPMLVKNHRVSEVLLAIPSLDRSSRNQALKKISDIKIQVRTLPSLMELAQGKVAIADLKELDIDDLLARDTIGPDESLLSKNVVGRVILVTGAGGSIGGELCRQLIRFRPQVLILVDHSEYALYQIHEELITLLHGLMKMEHHQVELVPVLSSITDKLNMEKLLTKWHPYSIYHAAAYKHVPLVEINPFEGVRNNTLGTWFLAELALKCEVPNFVLVSTDKAVRPTNVMGASKRLAEMTLQSLSEGHRKTIFTMVRFGNVLASSGSVIPKFRRQIKEGGPVTVTDFRMTRYFMTIPEAAQLVIQAGAMASGGEVFLLDMGEPVQIFDLAKRMIELSGLEVRDQDHPDGDIEISEIGLRAGEKLYEELLISGNPQTTSHPRIFKAHEESLTWMEMKDQLFMLEKILQEGDRIALLQILSQLIVGYQSTDLY